MEHKDGDVLNVQQVADMFGVHPNTVRNWVGNGTIVPSHRLPGSGFKRFSREEILRIRREMFTSFAPPVGMPEQRDDMPEPKATDA